MWLCVKNGYDYVIKGGSYVGQIRKQLPWLTAVINQPWIRPLAPIMPPNIPGPTDEDKITAYFVRYLMSDQLADNEVYSYGQFIVKQLRRVMDLLVQSKGNTNQATIAIGNAETTFLDDPPCLRTISFKVVNGCLNMDVYFRSWDLYAGFPENLGGLQILKEYVLCYLNESLQGSPYIHDGKLIAFSSGAHIYQMYFDIVNLLNVDKVKVMGLVLAEREQYIEEHGV